MNRIRNAGQQLLYLGHELKALVGHRPYRWLTMWFNLSVNVSYRLDRALYLLLGESYVVLRLLLFPLWLLLRVLGSRHEINYRADIGRGLRVMHAGLGVVVSAYAICGENLVLTGGNCIGGRKPLKRGDLILGNNVSLGANAVVLGPLRLGDGVSVGAGAVAVKDAPPGAVLVGVPAKPLIKEAPRVLAAETPEK